MESSWLVQDKPCVGKIKSFSWELMHDVWLTSGAKSNGNIPVVIPGNHVVFEIQKSAG